MSSDKLKTADPVESVVSLRYAKAGTQPPVFVAGSFTLPAWQPREMPFSRREDGEYAFEIEMKVPPGTWQYKYRLGPGDWWVLDEKAEKGFDAQGNENNVIVVVPVSGLTGSSEEESEADRPSDVVVRLFSHEAEGLIDPDAFSVEALSATNGDELEAYRAAPMFSHELPVADSSETNVSLGSERSPPGTEDSGPAQTTNLSFLSNVSERSPPETEERGPPLTTNISMLSHANKRSQPETEESASSGPPHATNVSVLSHGNERSQPETDESTSAGPPHATNVSVLSHGNDRSQPETDESTSSGPPHATNVSVLSHGNDRSQPETDESTSSGRPPATNVSIVSGSTRIEPKSTGKRI
ncbi:MAG: hypothetical protein M1826_007209 [Phylliscum demangeonii]|nr:MAG: hypothetical protein M1826_007209 [Phylliscum demangeonii]